MEVLENGFVLHNLAANFVNQNRTINYCTAGYRHGISAKTIKLGLIVFGFCMRNTNINNDA